MYREYEARLQRYNERIWICKSTGSLQLTHKEAWEEEQEVTELSVQLHLISVDCNTLSGSVRDAAGDRKTPFLMNRFYKQLLVLLIDSAD